MNIQPMTLIDMTYTDPVHGTLHVNVVCPFGRGGTSFDVMVNNYYKGAIVRYLGGVWVSHVRLGELNQDDIDAIMDAIEALSKLEPDKT